MPKNLLLSLHYSLLLSLHYSDECTSIIEVLKSSYQKHFAQIEYASH